MVTDDTIYQQFKYDPFLLERAFYSLPMWRKILACFFDKYRLSKNEYDKWFSNEMDRQIRELELLKTPTNRDGEIKE